MDISVLYKLIKFGVVGCSGLVIDFGFTYLLKEKLGVHKLLSNSVGFIMAASSNYYLNRVWTFESHNPNVSIEFSSFFAIALVGLLINNGILWLINTKFGFNFYVAKLIAIGITVIWNFGANFLVTFSS